MTEYLLLRCTACLSLSIGKENKSRTATCPFCNVRRSVVTRQEWTSGKSKKRDAMIIQFTDPNPRVVRFQKLKMQNRDLARCQFDKRD